MGETSDFLSSFTEKMLQVPYPANSGGAAGYNQRIKELGEEYLAECKQRAERKPQTEREVVAHALERYVLLLRRTNPNSFLAAQQARPKQNEENRNLRVALEKIITFLREGTHIVLSAEEKQWITKRETLLQKIPPEIQKELEINPEPAPLPAAEENKPVTP